MTLDEVKNYLRVDADFIEDDAYIQTLIDNSQTYIDSCVGTGYQTNANLVKLATTAQYKLINDLYNNRSQYIDGSFKRDIIIDTIFDMLASASDEVI
ncbi:phage protein [Clostridium pasteurianum DSM 525 = ATCC 6013]|uniref:Phage protein n=1 Tax=Clostridium pasteurianum DSM 525 = ATCC 6013 TaxID=1262449 RepID=A0A0H3JAG7_CLOPA|nr:head-tail connector protein [Clostridium pasteurianum]AJA49533.1 phage protein [Clostridium pasteurianum DSM 525 = ATCC 6013]AJA53521.1 phage protein [Clostridium pasteurianum DSM 525 = ATCC 6013]AOZ76692.1 DNA packaging protein [Clostridium pasteurianum DSM 525 = ATCC 6013]AOZ80489.1 DNA packaging protein [Clostridium pasteurianum]ELP58949.1 phage protein [Clostridium pasteurianum DSM 525 = ATCC 6013]